MTDESAASLTLAQAIPRLSAGMRVGLLGGSFNPPHLAHRAISQFAIKRLRLDRVWWLVTPGNPLKDPDAWRNLEARLEAARKTADDPRLAAAFRLDHGRRQPRAIPSLAELAAYRDAAPTRGDRSTAGELSCAGRARGEGLGALSPARDRSKPARRASSTGLGFSDGSETEPVLDRPAEPGRKLEVGVLVPLREGFRRHWNIETLDPKWLVSMWVAGDSVPAIQRKEWSLATPLLSKSVLPKAPRTARKTSTPAAALKAQPDADKTLNMILSRLDDMKAEETVTIDLRGKSAFSDDMIVTSGRANRHVGAIAENVAKGLKENGIKNIHVEGLPNCDWVLIDSGDVIVHVFRPEVREFYNLERLWTQGPTGAKVI